MTSIKLPSGVTSIGDYAFLDCNNLTRIELPSGLLNIGDEAFSECDNLTIYGKSGSYAENYAKEHNIPFKPLEEIQPAQKAIADCQITLSSGSYVYDGTEKKPDIIVKDGSDTLKKDIDYTVSYEKNIHAGTASATITGKGRYTGTAVKHYTITASSISKASIALSKTSYTYDGKPKEPAVTVTLNQKNLTEKTDYTVSYSNQIKAGTATVTITGTGNYMGTATKNYTITACNIGKARVGLSKSSYTYDGKEKKPAVTVILDKKKLTEKIDYTVKHSDNTKAGTATVTVTGKGNYTGTVKASFTILPEKKDKKSISKATVTLKKTSYAYDGKTKKPAVTVKLGKTTLKANKDYTVSYKGNKNIGKATVTIMGKGSYTGKVTKTFKITAKKGTSFTVDGNKFKITNATQVSFNGVKNTKATRVVIPATVKIGGKNFKVTSVAASALKNKTKVTSVTLGANVTAIGSNAFYGCKKLGTITIKSAKLKTVGKNAFKGMKATAKIKVPKSKEKSYKKLLKSKGQGSKVKIVKA